MGKEMYVLHENGRKLFSNAEDCTPLQRFFYIFAKDYHEEDHDSGPPNGYNQTRGLNSYA
jgi:hypothetical protein